VATYWLIGRRIVEYEQKGKERADYGEKLLEKVSRDLRQRFGRGFSPDNLEAMRRFYSAYKTDISETPSRKLKGQKSATTSRNFTTPSVINQYLERFVLSCLLIRPLLSS
jgi:hypothetical protein